MIQMCAWMDAYTNPVVIARSWADAQEGDWSFVRDLVVEIIADYEVEADLILEMALAIQKSGPRQLYVTYKYGEQYAVFWKDSRHEDIDFVWMWT